MANHTKIYGEEAHKYDTSDFQDESVKRTLMKLSDLERAILPEEQLKEVQRDRENSSLLCNHTFLPLNPCRMSYPTVSAIL